MFFPLFIGVFVGTVLVGLNGGPSRAVAAGWLPAAFLLPVWMVAGVGSLVLDLRTAAGLGVLVSLLLTPGGRFRLTFADCLVLGLVLVQMISAHQSGGLRPLTVPEVARKSLLPYLMGRLMLGSADDLARVVPLVAKLLVGLTAFALFECLTKVNPINTALGKTYGLLEQGEGYRWGLKRAHVTFDHPIFFGMALVLLLPWAIDCGRRAKVGGGPRWWRWLPLVMAAALFATVSRGPQLAGMATGAVYAFFRFPKIRLPFLILALGGGFAATTFKDQLVELLSVVAGEKGEDQEVRIIQIDGEDVEYSGTNHRVLLFRVYERPMEQAGLFGFGAELRGVQIDPSLEQRFGSIDCHYLLFLLQYGRLGVGAFLILVLGTLLNLARVAFQRKLPQAGLAAGLFGALAGVAALLMSVWFSPDFAGIWLFSAGLAGRLPYLASVPETPAASTDLPAVSAAVPLALRSASAPLRPLAPVAHYAG